MVTTRNLEALAGVTVSGKVKHEMLNWRPAKKGWFNSRDEGYICSDTGEYYTSDRLMSGEYNGQKLIVVEEYVYHKPFVELLFFNYKLDKKIEFDTYEEAKEWASKYLNLILKPLII